MGRFFNLENPVWKFIGNLADLFLLSVYWYLCCLPVFTIGSSTCALYYVTLKQASNQEGYTSSSYWRSFLSNFKQGTLLWLVMLAAGLVLSADWYWCLNSDTSMAFYLLPAFAIVTILFFIVLFMMFPLLARCENTTSALFKMSFAMGIRNFLPVLSTIAVTAGIFLTGIFAFWPLLLVAPGLSAYINSFIFNRVLTKYHLNLPD